LESAQLVRKSDANTVPSENQRVYVPTGGSDDAVNPQPVPGVEPFFFRIFEAGSWLTKPTHAVRRDCHLSPLRGWALSWYPDNFNLEISPSAVCPAVPPAAAAQERIIRGNTLIMGSVH
jgi:hypothetical protein